MSYTKKKAELEFEIIKKTVKDSIIAPFEKEILVLVDKFGNSGQSGGSAPYTAEAISQAIKKLMMQEPICDITGIDEEWYRVKEHKKPYYQNRRLSSIFKNGKEGKPFFIYAIIWQGKEEWDKFSGKVYVDNKDFQLIGSSQTIKLPFRPKRFYVNVTRINITREEAEKRDIHYCVGSKGCYYHVLKDKNELNEVFDYYEKPNWFDKTKIAVSKKDFK